MPIAPTCAGPDRRPSPTVRRVAAAVVVALAVLVGLAAPASAHAQLESSTPADGAVVPTAPSSVDLRFSESVTVAAGGVRVFDSGGKRVDQGNARHGSGGDSSVTVGLRGGLADGTYIVTWRVISADSHPVHGGFLFSVGAKSSVGAGLASSLTNGSGDKGWQVTAAILRIIAYVGVLLAGGVAVMVLAIGADADRLRLHRTVVLGAGAGAIAILLGLPVQATLASGLGAGAITEPGVLGQTLGEGVGVGVILAIVGLVLVLLAMRRGGPGAMPLAIAGATLAVGSFTTTGHTRATSPAWFVTLVDLTHLGAAAIWFGGLVVLGVVMRRLRGADDPAGAAKAVARFSGIATIALIAVSVAGFTLAYYEVQALRALTSTTYGRLLLLKVGVVGLIALAGGYNHYWLVPHVVANNEDEARWRSLGRAVRIEALAIVLVLGITGVLVNVTPARTAAGIGSVNSVTAPLGNGTINITIDPNRAGQNSLHIYLLDKVGREDDSPTALTLEFTQESHGIGPITRKAVKAGYGHWQYDGDALSLPGQWQITAKASVSEFQEDTAVLDVKVNP